jgi:hypothetical protein
VIFFLPILNKNGNYGKSYLISILYENPLVLAMAQAVSYRPLTLDIQVQSQAISCGICGRKKKA